MTQFGEVSKLELARFEEGVGYMVLPPGGRGLQTGIIPGPAWYHTRPCLISHPALPDTIPGPEHLANSPPAGAVSSFTQRVSPFYHPVNPKKRFSTAAGAIIAAGRASSFASLKTPMGGSEGGAAEDPEVRTHAMRNHAMRAPRHAH